MPHHSDGCVPRTVRSRSFKGGRQGVGPVACGDAWHVPGRIHSSMATAKTYQSPPMCLRKCAGQNVLASVVQHRHVAVFEGEVAALFLMTCNKNQLSLLGSMCQLLRQQLSIPTSPLSLEPLLSAGVWVAGVARIHHPHLLIIFGVDLMLGRDSTLTLFLGTSAEPMRACL